MFTIYIKKLSKNLYYIIKSIDKINYGNKFCNFVLFKPKNPSFLNLKTYFLLLNPINY